MRHSILAFLILGITVIFLGCSENNPISPELSKNTQAPTFFAKKDTTFFSGTSTTTAVLDPGMTNILPNGTVHIRGLVVQTADTLDDLRVSGFVTWVVNMDIYPDGTDKRWGTGELIIPEVGKWIMPYKGWLRDGYVTYEVDGHGKGDLRGLRAHWTYHTTPGNPFDVQGFIIER